MLRVITTLFIPCLLSACSHFEFSSNLDKENFQEYYKPGSVKVYEKQQLDMLEHEFIIAVEGSSCQEKERELPADIKEARTNARINAADAGANGIVFQRCINFESDESCISNIICYGRAIRVFENE